MANQHTNTQLFRNSLKFLFFTYVLFGFACKPALAQSYSSQNKRAIKHFNQAQSHFQKYELEEAIESLQKAIEKDNQFVEAITLMAYIYVDQGKYSKAKEHFYQAIQISSTAIPNNLFFLAELELEDGNYKLAKKYFTQFLSSNPQEGGLINKSKSGLEQIRFAERAIKNPVKFEPVNLGSKINSEYAEYFPALTVDEKTFLFTRRLPDQNSPLGYNEDFYISKKVNGEWKTSVNLTPINTPMNEGAPSLSADGQVLFFTACELYGNYGENRKGHGSCDLFYSFNNGEKYSKPINLGKPINSNNWETQPSFSSDGKTLYFVRGIRNEKRTKKGDIYVSKLTQENYWSKPEKLSNVINTPKNEESVFIHPDGKTLYFSSDGHTGMGGLDIFISRKDSNGNWQKPINLGYPINTHENENSLLIGAAGKTAYFASDRTGGFGDLDLYSFELYEDIRPIPVSYFTGKIKDKQTNKPIQAKFELIDLSNGEIVIESSSNQLSGEFLISLPTGKEYALNASKKGYLFYSENFKLNKGNSHEPFQKDILMQPIKVGGATILKNIFFETASYELKSNSKAELEKLIRFMQENPEIKIEIGGHTDDVGEDEDNMKLSKNRAQTVVDYLIKHGIEADRLEAKGYGEHEPITENDSERGRAQNRRTEFKIIAVKF